MIWNSETQYEVFLTINHIGQDNFYSACSTTDLNRNGTLSFVCLLSLFKVAMMFFPFIIILLKVANMFDMNF